MGYRTLIETWVGMSWEEITDNWKPPAKKEDYEAAVEGEKNKLANAILEGIIKRAQVGELDAVSWLEERGLLKLPSREVSKASKAIIESGVSQEELREAEELQQAIAKLTEEANNARMTTSDVGRGSGCLGVALSLVGVIVAAIFLVIQVGVVFGIQ